MEILSKVPYPYNLRISFLYKIQPTMKASISIFLKVLGVFLLLLSMSSCTVVGYMIGNAEDSGKSSTNHIWTNSPRDLPLTEGNLIEVHINNGSVIKGYFVDIQKLAFDEPLELLRMRHRGKTLPIKLEHIDKVEVLATIVR